MAGRVGDVKPVVTDEGEQHLAGANCVLDDSEKVVAGSMESTSLKT